MRVPRAIIPARRCDGDRDADSVASKPSLDLKRRRRGVYAGNYFAIL